MLQRALAMSMVAALIASVGQPPSLSGASITDQALDRNTGALTFTLRNDSPTDLVAWVYAITVQSSPRHADRATRHMLHDEGMTHALATTPGLKNRPLQTGHSYLPAGNTREIVERLLPPVEHRVAPRTLESATVALSAVLFADGRAMGDPNEVARIVESRKRQAAESLGLLRALQKLRTNKDADADAVKELRAAAKGLSKAASELVENAARQIEVQPDANARKRALEAVIEAYEVRQAVLTQAIIVQ